MATKVECGIDGRNIVIETCDYCGASAEAEYDRDSGEAAQDEALTRAVQSVRCESGCLCQACDSLQAESEVHPPACQCDGCLDHACEADRFCPGAD